MRVSLEASVSFLRHSNLTVVESRELNQSLASSFRGFQQVFNITNIRKRKKLLRPRGEQNTGKMDDTVESLAGHRQRVRLRKSRPAYREVRVTGHVEGCAQLVHH